MHIKKIRLLHIRNYEDRIFTLSPYINLFTGPNGIGKTNILEAVHFCSVGKSYRTMQDDDLIQYDCDEGAVFIDFEKNGMLHTIRIRISRENGKKIYFNETPTRKKDLMGIMQTVLFSPDELQLIKGPPQNRRRFLDLEISQVNPRYYEELSRYNRAVMQRNAAFRNAYFSGREAHVDAWDMQIASGAAYLVRKRVESLRQMNGYAEKMQNMLSNNREKLVLRYEQPYGKEIMTDEDWYIRKLAEARKEDQRLFHTSVGPHRDDIVFEINGKNLARFGSQGQQRTAILSLKLSELEFIREETREYPVLLLDDVCSELDSERKKKLFNFLSGKVQTLITSSENINLLQNAQVIALDNVSRETMGESL